MKTNIFERRLRQFALYLYKLGEHPEQGLFETVHLGAIEDGETDDEKIVIWYEMKYPHYIFDELVQIFPDHWEFSERGNPVLMNLEASEGTDMEQNTVADVCIFFDLSLEELSIFDLEGYQLESLGSKKLDFNSTVSDFAFNIAELVKRRKG